MDCIKELLSINSEYKNELLAVKTALVKFMLDKGCYFDVMSRIDKIFDDFTFNNIISLWAGNDVNILDEKKLFLESDARFDIYTFITNADISFKEESSSLIGRIFESSISLNEKKKNGVTYTPEDLCEYMISLVRSDIKKGDKLIDPACGCGVFLEGFYDALMYISCDETSDEKIFGAHKRILAESVYGCDASATSCAIAKIVLALKYPVCAIAPHIYCCDSLLDIREHIGDIRFDWAVTNPPYVGHKQIDSRYRKKISELYSSVYYDKADLSYCFFMLGENLLKQNGKLLFITGRYLAQSKFAKGLRSFLLDNFSFITAVDFYGARPFKNAGVDPMILYLKKTTKKNKLFKAIKYSPDDEFDIFSLEKNSFNASVSNLSSESFNFLTQEQRAFSDTVETLCQINFEDVADFFQGIITGCDKAFVVPSESLLYSQCIDECGKKWLKSKDLKDGSISFRGQYVLYTNSLKSIEEAPNTKKRLEMFETMLMQRRECIRGTRKWYELQWGRNPLLFEEPKVIFAYKGYGNNFIYDTSAYYFSADIYGFKIKKEYSELDVQKLIMLLNTPIYDKYFKTFAKKLGGKLYEYYPNTVERIKIPSVEIINSFETERDIYEYFHIDADML